MYGIYNYITETDHVSRIYNIAAILYLQFMVEITLFSILNALYFYISTFRGIFVVPNVAVVCSSFIQCCALHNNVTLYCA
jgi:hypothetical protein